MKKYEMFYGMRRGCLSFTGKVEKVPNPDPSKPAIEYLSVRCDCGKEDWRRRYTFLAKYPLSCPNCKKSVFSQGALASYQTGEMLRMCELARTLFLKVPLRPKLSTKGKFI